MLCFFVFLSIRRPPISTRPDTLFPYSTLFRSSEIRAIGGEALVDGSSVTDFAAVEAMVSSTVGKWGRVDILVNNAGFLRDSSFAKMDLADRKSTRLNSSH